MHGEVSGEPCVVGTVEAVEEKGSIKGTVSKE